MVFLFPRTDSRFNGKLLAVGLLYLDDYNWCLFRHESNSWRFEWVGSYILLYNSRESFAEKFFYLLKITIIMCSDLYVCGRV